jgi:Tol biopolymer transport system component/DNA-binding winged helix-turn-helix (wHTH) protein
MEADASRRSLRFGVFELDLRAGELRKNGVKIKLQEQPFQILAMLLEHPGEIVTREELQQKLWSNDTFVDFDNGLNKSINKIREALGDSADNPRFVETMARRGYRFIAPVDETNRDLASGNIGTVRRENSVLTRRGPDGKPSVGELKRKSALRWAFWIKVGLGVALGTGCVGIGWWLLNLSKPTRTSVLTRLTFDNGLTLDPALSTDGKLLAYASDRSGEGNLDIWVQYIGGGQPLRLTNDPADESQPSFSPDGSKIVFRSEIGEGGIYVMPVLGGKPRLIATKGRNPRFSPDGTLIAYWDNGARGLDPLIISGRTVKMYVVPSNGGPFTQVRPEFDVARFPLWTPDGKNLLFWGAQEPEIMGNVLARDEGQKGDWWVTPLHEGAPVATHAFQTFRQAGLLFGAPSCWSAAGVHVIFSATLGDANNLWQVPLSPGSWQVVGPPEQLTFGTGGDNQPSVSADRRMVFSSVINGCDIWSLPIDANRGKVMGNIERVTKDTGVNRFFDLTADGKKLLFLSTRTGNSDIWLRDMESGKESQLTATPENEIWTKMSGDGSRISSSEEIAANNRNSIYEILSGDGAPKRLCEDCAGPYHWSSDGKWFLYRTLTRPTSIGLLNVVTGKKGEFLKHPRYEVYNGYFSPDDRWITFGTQISVGRDCLFIVPFREETAPKESEWIPVTDGTHFDLKSRWSPNGNLLYFVSTRDGYLCIWAQRLDPRTKLPLGSPFEVYASHDPRLSLSNLNGGSEFSVGPDQLFFSLGERTGNIWTTTLKQ